MSTRINKQYILDHYNLDECRKTKRVDHYIEDLDISNGTYSINEFVTMISNQSNCCGAGFIKVGMTYNGPEFELMRNIDELETDNEVIKRLIKLETDKRKALKKEAKELEEYKRLKAKFEKS